MQVKVVLRFCENALRVPAASSSHTLIGSAAKSCRSLCSHPSRRMRLIPFLRKVSLDLVTGSNRSRSSSIGVLKWKNLNVLSITAQDRRGLPAGKRLDADLAQVRAKLSGAPKVQNRPCLRSGKGHRRGGI